MFKREVFVMTIPAENINFDKMTNDLLSIVEYVRYEDECELKQCDPFEITTRTKCRALAN